MASGMVVLVADPGVVNENRAVSSRPRGYAPQLSIQGVTELMKVPQFASAVRVPPHDPKGDATYCDNVHV